MYAPTPKDAKSYMERKNTMFRKTWHPILTKDQISRLRGGEKHNFRYFVEVLETPESDVFLYILDEGRIPLVADPTERFEAYLSLRSPEFLRDLLALLDMPDAPRKPAEPGLLRVA